ncbi:MAG: hypothetical protein RJA49_2264, partial [Actinomycetota bacterium]
MTMAIPAERERRTTILAIAAYSVLRVLLILSTRAFETPDTASYRSGQRTRPPVGAALLSWLSNEPYVLVSAIVSTAGFVALAVALWDPARRRWSVGVTTALWLASLIPAVSIYEHWLVPDSVLVGLCLIALALAWPQRAGRWVPWVIVPLCLVITATKEVGIGAVVLIALVVVVRRSARLGGAILLSAALLFVTVVLPCSNRHGAVLWNGPSDTELTMARFRVIVAGLAWPDLSPELAVVHQRAGECGMDMTQLMFETFLVTDQVVGFEHCPDLWPAVDEVSQLDVLVAHARHPAHIRSAVERGFAADMTAMSEWSGYRWGASWWLGLDRLLAAALALLPCAAAVVAVMRRRGRRLAMIAMLGTAMAFVSTLLDPSSQDRHSMVFRVVAAAVALMALTDATAVEPADPAVDDLSQVDGPPV